MLYESVGGDQAPDRTLAMQDAGYGLRRIYLPHTPVNSAVADPQLRLRKVTMPARITSGQLKMDSRKVAPSVRALT